MSLMVTSTLTSLSWENTTKLECPAVQFFKNEIGVDVEYDETKNNPITIVFPNGDRRDNISTGFFSIDPRYTIFYDLDNSFIFASDPYYSMSMNNSFSNIYPKALIKCSKGYGRFFLVDTYSNWTLKDQEINIPSAIYMNDCVEDNIKIFPLYSRIYGLINGVYCNCQRMFTPNIKIKDSENNIFVTLGGYFLYKIN